MTNSPRGREPLALSGGPLGELRFNWSGDRYAHHWHFADETAGICLRSVESDSQIAWPASPPLQQIHRQSFGDGREVVFGIGMAGRGHWSASFTLVPQLKCWIVELACRSSVAPGELTSTYQLQGHWETAEDGRAVCQDTQQPLSLEAIVPGSIARLDGDVLTVRPTESAGPATTQWAFRLCRPGD